MRQEKEPQCEFVFLNDKLIRDVIQMINVLIADDHAMMREGLKRMLSGADTVRVVAEAKDGDEVLKKVVMPNINFLLLDISMPGISGVELIESIKRLRHHLPILILSMHNTIKIATSMLQAGAKGYLAKDTYPEKLVEIIESVANGGVFIDPSIANKMVFERSKHVAPHERLSPRELQILKLLVVGQPVSKIATDLGVSPKTISTHKARLMEKIDVKNSTELILYASEHYIP